MREKQEEQEERSRQDELEMNGKQMKKRIMKKKEGEGK